MSKFDTPTPITAVLDVPAGRVRFVAADRHDTVVEVLPADSSKGRDVQVAEQTTVDHVDGVLRITASAKKQFFGPTGSVDVTVHLPAGSRVEAKAAGAGFQATGRLGDVVVEGAYGSVDLEEVVGARLTLLGGDVTVGHLGGPAEISTTKGDIRITEAVSGSVVLRTEAGDVSVGTAAGVSATLDAGTSYGRIDNALKNTEGATAHLAIHATTAYGDITARSL